ncbi:PP2C family protein-serine/threonine phosphatase [Rhodocaloribacter sp.]
MDLSDTSPACPAPPAAPAPRLRAFGATDAGRRERNEDRFFCDPARGLFMVVDGVGGYAAGDVAAEMARDLVSMRLCEDSGTIEERLHRAITTANRAIFHQSRTRASQRGMACVLTAAVVEDGVVTVGHVGDTRLYVIRPGDIVKVTRDHSPVGMREDAGDLSEWEAMLHPRRNEILRDVGSTWREPGDEDFIDLYRFPFDPESALLLCTDGLTDLVPSEVLHETVTAHAGHPERSVAALIRLANRAGGHDNVTVVVIEGEAFGNEARAEKPEPPKRARRHAPARSASRDGLRTVLWIYVLTAVVTAALWVLLE